MRSWNSPRRLFRPRMPARQRRRSARAAPRSNAAPRRIAPRHERSRGRINDVLRRLQALCRSSAASRKRPSAAPAAARSRVLPSRRWTSDAAGTEGDRGPDRTVKAMLCESSDQSGQPSRTPCQSISARRNTSLRVSPKILPRPHLHPSEAMRDQHLYEPMQVPVPVEQAPVEPADLVVLAIGVVVAVLRAAHFVAHQQHRRAERGQQHDDEVLHLAAAQRFRRPRPRLGPRPRNSRTGCCPTRRGCLRRSPRCAWRCRKPGRSA